jgi:hypothetical protein
MGFIGLAEWTASPHVIDWSCTSAFLTANSTATNWPFAGALLVFLFYRRFFRCRSKLSGKLSIERGIVKQRVDDLKTIYSGRKMSIDVGMLAVLRAWKQTTQFSGDEDWVFASPARLGRQPWSYDQVWRSFLSDR